MNRLEELQTKLNDQIQKSIGNIDNRSSVFNWKDDEIIISSDDAELIVDIIDIYLNGK